MEENFRIFMILLGIRGICMVKMKFFNKKFIKIMKKRIKMLVVVSVRR